MACITIIAHLITMPTSHLNDYITLNMTVSHSYGPSLFHCYCSVYHPPRQCMTVVEMNRARMAARYIITAPYGSTTYDDVVGNELLREAGDSRRPLLVKHEQHNPRCDPLTSLLRWLYHTPGFRASLYQYCSSPPVLPPSPVIATSSSSSSSSSRKERKLENHQLLSPLYELARVLARMQLRIPEQQSSDSNTAPPWISCQRLASSLPGYDGRFPSSCTLRAAADDLLASIWSAYGYDSKALRQPLLQVFQGSWQIDQHCHTCDHHENGYDHQPFNQWLLTHDRANGSFSMVSWGENSFPIMPLPNGAARSLVDIIHEWITIDGQLTDDTICRHCHRRSIITRRRRIAMAPPSLLIHFDRYYPHASSNEGSSRRDATSRYFPQYLDLSQWSTPSCIEHAYAPLMAQLRSCLIHDIPIVGLHHIIRSYVWVPLRYRCYWIGIHRSKGYADSHQCMTPQRRPPPVPPSKRQQWHDSMRKSRHIQDRLIANEWFKYEWSGVSTVSRRQLFDTRGQWYMNDHTKPVMAVAYQHITMDDQDEYHDDDTIPLTDDQLLDGDEREPEVPPSLYPTE
jgi:hypothetical protein